VSLNASRWPIASTRTQPSDFIEEFLLGHTLGIGRYGSIGHRLGFVLGAPSLLTTMVHQLKDRPDELKAFIARYLKPVRQEADWGGIFIRARKAGEMLTSNNIALAPNHLPKEYFDSRARGLNVLQELPLLFVYGKADVVMVADGLSASQYGRDTWGAICNRHPLSGSLEVDAGHFSYGDLTDSIMDSATKHFERVNASLAQ
jgi:hypothetical protein